jgi:hypothetical protein
VNPIHVLAFAADPLSAPHHDGNSRLRVDEEVRLIREKLRAADFGDLVTFEVRWAARTDDLLQALNETHPEVVHFSGHGRSDGLVLVGKDGYPYSVDGAALAQLFRVFKSDLRVVVLSACLSLPEARVIAEVVGCAIGTPGDISDQAAITFGASFYRAIAFGRSVQDAFEQARAALALNHHDHRECPELVARADVDPAQLFLLRGPTRYLAPPSDPAALEGDIWRELPPLLAHLYPSGPHEEHVWARAGGNPSRLPSGGSAHAAWYGAISLLRRGGGGATVESLLREAREDYPLNADLLRLLQLASPSARRPAVEPGP